jgi:hypothetical protein
METIISICVGLLFVSLAINIPSMIAYLVGLKFQITDFNCKEEVKGVKTNILMTKIIQTFNVIIQLGLIILLSIIN